MDSTDKSHVSLQENRKEEDQLYKLATRNAEWEALRQLREDRLRLWKEFLPANEDTEIPDEQEFEKIWNEEIERTKNMLDNFYHNLQIINGTKLYKKTTVLKNEEGQEAVEVTSVIMVRHLTSSLDVDKPLQIYHRIVGRNMTSRYKFQQKEVDESDPNTAIVTENKSVENAKLIQHFTVAEAMKNQLDQTENPGQKIQEILQQYTNKPKITSIQITK